MNINHIEEWGADHDEYWWFTLSELEDLHIEYRENIVSEIKKYLQNIAIQKRREEQKLWQVKRITAFVGGQSHETYNIDDTYVLKVYKRHKQQEHFEWTKILSEHAILWNSAPKIIKTWEYDETFGGPVILMEYIEGKNLTELYYQYTAEEKKKIHREMAKILQKIHSIDTGVHSWSTTGLYRRICTTLENIKKKKSLRDDALAKISERLENYIPWEESVEQGYIHGDFHMENILQTKDGNLTLIDRDSSKLAPKWMERSMLFEQSVIPVAIVAEELEKHYADVSALETLSDIKHYYPSLFSAEDKDELYLLAIERILYKFDLWDEVQNKQRAYEMGYLMYDEIFENGLVEKLVGVR